MRLLLEREAWNTCHVRNAGHPKSKTFSDLMMIALRHRQCRWHLDPLPTDGVSERT